MNESPPNSKQNVDETPASEKRPWTAPAATVETVRDATANTATPTVVDGPACHS